MGQTALRDSTPDPRMTNCWRLEIEGVPAGWVQEVDEPDLEHTEDSFSDGRVEIKVTTGAKYGDMTLRKLVSVGSVDGSIYDWFLLGFDPETGRMGAPSLVKRHGDLIYVDGEGNDIERMSVEGMRPKKRSGQKLVKKPGDAKIYLEEATFSVDSFTRSAASP